MIDLDQPYNVILVIAGVVIASLLYLFIGSLVYTYYSLTHPVTSNMNIAEKANRETFHKLTALLWFLFVPIILTIQAGAKLGRALGTPRSSQPKITKNPLPVYDLER